MPLFTSAREKRLWLYVGGVLVAILATLLFGRPFVDLFRSQDLQAAVFLLGMILVAATIVVYGLRARPGKRELTLWLGLAAVYLMFFLRLGLPERSHLIEYSVLAIFISRALTERFGPDTRTWIPALIAFLATVLLGALDESIQLFLPERVFDWQDILFNCLAAFMAIVASMVLSWVRKNRMANGLQPKDRRLTNEEGENRIP